MLHHLYVKWYSLPLVTVLSATIDDPTGYGRIIRNESGEFIKSVEHKDANEEELKSHEINSGMYVFNTWELSQALDKIQPNNAQGEYYLPDTLTILFFVHPYIIFFCQYIHDIKANIMSGMFIFLSRISKSRYNVHSFFLLLMISAADSNCFWSFTPLMSSGLSSANASTRSPLSFNIVSVSGR